LKNAKIISHFVRVSSFDRSAIGCVTSFSGSSSGEGRETERHRPFLQFAYHLHFSEALVLAFCLVGEYDITFSGDILNLQKFDCCNYFLGTASYSLFY